MLALLFVPDRLPEFWVNLAQWGIKRRVRGTIGLARRTFFGGECSMQCFFSYAADIIHQPVCTTETAIQIAGLPSTRTWGARLDSTSRTLTKGHRLLWELYT